MRHMVSGTDIPTLVFSTERLYKEFKAAERDLHFRFYEKIVEQTGYYAGNKGKFVADPAELNDWEDKDYKNWLKWKSTQA